MPSPSSPAPEPPHQQAADSTPPPSNNQRRTTRRLYVNFAWYKRIDDLDGEGVEGVARSADVSEEGVGVLVTRPLPVASRLLLELVTSSGSVTAIGSVRHVREASNGAYRLGIAIEVMPPNHRRLWQQLAKPSKSA